MTEFLFYLDHEIECSRGVCEIENRVSGEHFVVEVDHIESHDEIGPEELVY